MRMTGSRGAPAAARDLGLREIEQEGREAIPREKQEVKSCCRKKADEYPLGLEGVERGKLAAVDHQGQGRQGACRYGHGEPEVHLARREG